MSALLGPKPAQPPLAPPATRPPVVADAVLMNRLAQRDATALVELERRHRSSLYAQVYGVLMDAASAERVVRDAFTHLWFEAPRYNGQRGPWALLREIARELARAERALHDSAVIRR